VRLKAVVVRYLLHIGNSMRVVRIIGFLGGNGGLAECTGRRARESFGIE
jgi:hypothetical protein